MSDFSTHSRNPLRLHARCHACSRAYLRAYHAEHPDKQPGYQQRYYQRHIEKKRADSRAYQRRRRADPELAPILKEQDRRSWEKMRNDPKRWAERLADQRMDYHLRAERNGQSTRQIREKTYANGNGAVKVKRVRVPVEPVAALISEWLGEFGGQSLGEHVYHGHGPHAAGFTVLAELTGLADRTLSRIVNRERGTVDFLTADAICGALGTPLTSLYTQGEL